MIDFNSGSDTKVLVKEVLKWEKANRSEEGGMFSAHEFMKLKEIYQEVYEILSDFKDEPYQMPEYHPPNTCVAENDSGSEKSEGNNNVAQTDHILRLKILCEKSLEYQN